MWNSSLSAPAPVQTLSSSGPGASGPAVQREADDEEELQGLFVQRHAGHDHEPEDAVQGLFVQREAPPEEEDESLQGLFVQREAEDEEELPA